MEHQICTYEQPQVDVIVTDGPLWRFTVPTERPFISTPLGNGGMICRGEAIETKCVSTLGAPAQVNRIPKLGRPK